MNRSGNHYASERFNKSHINYNEAIADIKSHKSSNRQYSENIQSPSLNSLGYEQIDDEYLRTPIEIISSSSTQPRKVEPPPLSHSAFTKGISTPKGEIKPQKHKDESIQNSTMMDQSSTTPPSGRLQQQATKSVKDQSNKFDVSGNQSTQNDPNINRSTRRDQTNFQIYNQRRLPEETNVSTLHNVEHESPKQQDVEIIVQSPTHLSSDFNTSCKIRPKTQNQSYGYRSFQDAPDISCKIRPTTQNENYDYRSFQDAPDISCKIRPTTQNENYGYKSFQGAPDHVFQSTANEFLDRSYPQQSHSNQISNQRERSQKLRRYDYNIPQNPEFDSFRSPKNNNNLGNNISIVSLPKKPKQQKLHIYPDEPESASLISQQPQRQKHQPYVENRANVQQNSNLLTVPNITGYTSLKNRPDNIFNSTERSNASQTMPQVSKKHGGNYMSRSFPSDVSSIQPAVARPINSRVVPVNNLEYPSSDVFHTLNNTQMGLSQKSILSLQNTDNATWNLYKKKRELEIQRLSNDYLILLATLRDKHATKIKTTPAILEFLQPIDPKQLRMFLKKVVLHRTLASILFCENIEAEYRYGINNYSKLMEDKAWATAIHELDALSKSNAQQNSMSHELLRKSKNKIFKTFVYIDDIQSQLLEAYQHKVVSTLNPNLSIHNMSSKNECNELLEVYYKYNQNKYELISNIQPDMATLNDIKSYIKKTKLLNQWFTACLQKLRCNQGIDQHIGTAILNNFFRMQANEMHKLDRKHIENFASRKSDPIVMQNEAVALNNKQVAELCEICVSLPKIINLVKNIKTLGDDPHLELLKTIDQCIEMVQTERTLMMLEEFESNNEAMESEMRKIENMIVKENSDINMFRLKRIIKHVILSRDRNKSGPALTVHVKNVKQNIDGSVVIEESDDIQTPNAPTIHHTKVTHKNPDGSVITQENQFTEAAPSNVHSKSVIQAADGRTITKEKDVNISMPSAHVSSKDEISQTNRVSGNQQPTNTSMDDKIIQEFVDKQAQNKSIIPDLRNTDSRSSLSAFDTSKLNHTIITTTYDENGSIINMKEVRHGPVFDKSPLNVGNKIKKTPEKVTRRKGGSIRSKENTIKNVSSRSDSLEKFSKVEGNIMVSGTLSLKFEDCGKDAEPSSDKDCSIAIMCAEPLQTMLRRCQCMCPPRDVSTRDLHKLEDMERNELQNRLIQLQESRRQMISSMGII